MALQDNALVTVASLQAAGMTQSEEALGEKINLVSDLIEDFCGYPLRYQEGIEELCQGDGGKRLYLSRRPIVALAEVRFLDEVQELSEFAFPLNSREEGWVYRRRGWPLDLDAQGWTGFADYSTESYPIQCTYAAGWWLPGDEGEKPDGVQLLPSRIIEAAKATCQFLFANPAAGTDRVLKERTAAGYSVEFADDKPTGGREKTWSELIPVKAQRLLAKYVSV